MPLQCGMATRLSTIASDNWTRAASSLPDARRSGKCDMTHPFTPMPFLTMCISLQHRTLQELVEHYSKDSDGLCVNLCKPCVQVMFRESLHEVLNICLGLIAHFANCIPMPTGRGMPTFAFNIIPHC